MMLAWLTATGAGGLARWIWIAIVAAAITGAIVEARRTVDHILASTKEAGVTEARADQAQATLNQVERANAASDDLRRDPGVADVECVRNARNKAAC